MIILASKSPRRREILTSHNINYLVYAKDTDETTDSNFSPIVNTMKIALQKAMSISNENKDNTILAADTVVVLDNQILGKPKNKNDAYDMLCKLSGRTHEVITAFAILGQKSEKKIVDYDVSKVRFKNLSTSEIEAYLATDEPYDKAGSYAIQGVASKFIEEVKGDFENIVGLPMKKIKIYLNNF